MQQYEQIEYELEEDELALGGDDELEQGEDTETEGGSDTETENDNWQQLRKGDEEEIENDGSIRLDEGEVGQQPLHSQQPSILVWAKLPVNPGPSAPPADIDRWISILEFPIPDLTQLRLSKKPYKWIRFATGIVIGAKGDLRKTDDTASDLVDYGTETLPAVTTPVYYHISDDERQRMFPIDMDMANELVTSTTAMELDHSFRPQVANRDGNRCIVTGATAVVCDAAHLLPYGKGNPVRTTLHALIARSSSPKVH